MQHTAQRSLPEINNATKSVMNASQLVLVGDSTRTACTRRKGAGRYLQRYTWRHIAGCAYPAYTRVVHTQAGSLRFIFLFLPWENGRLYAPHLSSSHGRKAGSLHLISPLLEKKSRLSAPHPSYSLEKRRLCAECLPPPKEEQERLCTESLPENLKVTKKSAESEESIKTD